MPLSKPAERERIHTRAIEINGYRRTDGHYDIEAHLTDSKSFGQTNYDRGYIEAGEPIHDMWMRLTIDEQMHINPNKARREMAAEGNTAEKPGSDALDKRITEKWGGGNKILNTCLAYDDKGPLVKRRWPHLYKGADATTEAAE